MNMDNTLSPVVVQSGVERVASEFALGWGQPSSTSVGGSCDASVSASAATLVLVDRTLDSAKVVTFSAQSSGGSSVSGCVTTTLAPSTST